MQLSIVISTTPNRITYLASLLSNLAKQNYAPDEVLVVSDKNKSETIRNSISNTLYNLNLRIISSGGYGLSKARNRGVEASLGDIVLFIDDDIIIPDPNTLFRAKEAFEEDERLGVYGVQVKPLLYNSVKLPDKFNWLFGCTDDKAVRPVGAFFAVRRECFNVVGLFSENLGRKGNLISGEETELFNRIQKYMGLKIVLDNSLKVYHLIYNRGWRYILKRAFAEGVSKARFRGYNYSAERKYLKRYLKDPVGWLIAGTTLAGFLACKLTRR